MAIYYYYNTYDSKYEIISEERFNKFVSMRKIDPGVPLFYVKDINGLINDLLNHFGKGILVLFLVGIILAIIFSNSFGLFIPFIGWLLFGGFRSLVNFLEDFHLYNNFNKKLNSKFNSFDSYDEYKNFVKFEKL
jgi:hypothetical protein